MPRSSGWIVHTHVHMAPVGDRAHLCHLDCRKTVPHLTVALIHEYVADLHHLP